MKKTKSISGIFPLNAFKLLEEAISIKDVEKVLSKTGVEDKYRMSTEVYPKLDFGISREQIEALKSDGILSESGEISGVKDQNALTRLLYAMAWKQGDLKKIHNIIAGIEADNDQDRKSAFVFYHFGKHLRDKNEPIIDQNVIRAFGICKELQKNEIDDKAIARLKKLGSIAKKDTSLIQDYKNWLENKLTSELRACDDYVYHVDQVLFAIGRKLKKES